MEQPALLRFKSEEEASKKARDDLRALIKSSGGRLNCKALQSLREESERKKEEVDRELIFNIEKKVQEISKGVQMLSEREEVTRDVRLKIGNIKEIWENSCGKFSDISAKVDDLLQKKRYVEQVLGMLQNFLDMEQNVEELQAKLKDEDEIFMVYKQIKIMNYMRSSFLQKIEQSNSSTDLKSNGVQSKDSASVKLQRIKDHFRAVRELELQFHEQVVQGNLQSVHMLAKKNPSLLVKVLRVIENDDVANQSLQTKFQQKEDEEQKKLSLGQLGRDTEVVVVPLALKFDIKKINLKRKVDPNDTENQTLKEKSLVLLRMIIRRRADDFFQAEVEVGSDIVGTTYGQLKALLQRAEALVMDLKYIKVQVEPCFPPSYKIFELHVQEYKSELQVKIDSMLAGPLMDQLLSEDPESILAFSAFTQTCQGIINDLQFQDDFFLNLQIRLEEYYPRFFEHAEGKIYERLERIHSEVQQQEQDKLDLYGKPNKKKAKQTFDTSLSLDVYEYFNDQLLAISESLKGEKLIEFVKRMMEQFLGLLKYIVSTSIDQDQKNPKTPILLVIRLNDLTKVASEFSKFKDQVIQCIGEEYRDRLDNVLDKDFRSMIEHANAQAELIALTIVRGSIQEDLFLHFFTVSWLKGHSEMLEEVLNSAGAAMNDKVKHVNEDRFASKVAESLYTMLVQAYVERFLIAVNMRYKLKLPIEKPLLNLIYEDSMLKKGDSNKKILKTHLIDFYAKTSNIDNEIFEIIQQDLKLFQEFREAYKDEILNTRFSRVINLLSLVSLMVNSGNEDEFGSYEEQFWALVASQAPEDSDPKIIVVVGPGNIHIDGTHIVRACRKIKTKNGRQKGFFAKTKKKELMQMKLQKQGTVNLDKKGKK